MDAQRLGANLVDGGATFRTWAPNALSVHLHCGVNDWQPIAMEKQVGGYWFAFVPEVVDGEQYKYYVNGSGSSGFKRDSHARSIDRHGDRNCKVTAPDEFPWHDQAWTTPPFEKFIIYQMHVGAFFAVNPEGADVRRQRVGTFLDAIQKIEYLSDLGITAIQLLPIQEFRTARSLGYNGTNYFAPEVDYSLDHENPNFSRGLSEANRLLAEKGCSLYSEHDLDCQTKQLMAFIDLCHVYGIAVILDVVYNHAGGNFGDEGIYFYDRQPTGDNNRSLYFTDQGWAGGLGFAYWNDVVRQYLIDNARFFIDEYHVDGFRYDEVTVIDRFGGWQFIQDLTNTVRFHDPAVFQIAEYWADHSTIVRPTSRGGGGFDSVLDDGLKHSIRQALTQAAAGNHAFVELGAVARNLVPKHGPAWRQVQHTENHDIVRVDNTTDRGARIAALAGGNDARSWYARSRSRWANGLLLTCPGVPMLFMGQEFMEDKYWSDSPDFYRQYLIFWEGLENQKTMQDHLRFIRELCWLRRRYPGLTSNQIQVHHWPDSNRVLAFQRWIEGVGENVVVVASLNELPLHDYRIGFPLAGRWREVFNSDAYDNWVNPSIVGNGGEVFADAMAWDGMPASSTLSIPANGFLVFARN